MTHVRKLMLSGWHGQPAVECMVELEIDLDRMAAQLGEKAFRNRSKRSRIGSVVMATVRPVAKPD